MSTPSNDIGLDPISADRLAAAGFDYRLVAGVDAAFDQFTMAVDRGFLGGRPSAEEMAGRRERFEDSRGVAVHDLSASSPEVPVATLVAWGMEVTVDVDAFLPLWSISAVTVLATHRRRGIARAMLEGELRAASAAGYPIAGLTVSEATIYGRYGFGVATHGADWTINAGQAGWRGPRPTEGDRPGRLDHVEQAPLAAELAALNEATRGRRPGEVEGFASLWQELAGIRPGKSNDRVRGVTYTDADGVVQGALAYVLEPDKDDFTNHTLRVNGLLAKTPDAYAALWRYALDHDLVRTVAASLRGLDEPLRWMLADQRALKVTERDHHWLRILDVPVCLGARRYRAAGSVLFEVDDPLGLAAGTWRLTVDAQGAAVVEAASASSEQDRVRLGVAELSSLLLGGVRASVLRAAGQLDCDEATASWLDVAFQPVSAPVLSYWY